MTSSAIALRQRAHDIRMLGGRTLAAFAAIWGALITWLSSQPSISDRPHGIGAHVLFNSGHAPLFGVFAAGVAFAIAAPSLRPLPGVAACAAGLAAAVAFGAVDELHQSFVAGRTSSWTDVATDAVGAAITLWGLRYLAGAKASLGGFLARVAVGAAAMAAAGAGATLLDHVSSASP